MNKEVQELPEDLKFFADRLFSGNCSCDLSVGHVCESCTLFSLLNRASTEIINLRERLSGGKKMNKEDIMKLPIAEFTGANFLGRNIYIINGVQGIYRMRCYKDKSVPTVSARRNSRKGGSWAETVFVRCQELENRLRAAITGPIQT
jgi:hypothetical protein